MVVALNHLFVMGCSLKSTIGGTPMTMETPILTYVNHYNVDNRLDESIHSPL